MNEDQLALARHLLNVFPNIRNSITAAALASCGLYAALIIFEPFLEPRVDGYLRVYPPNSNNIFLIALTVSSGVSWLFRRFNSKARQEADFARVIKTLDDAMGKGQYSKLERKAVWRAVVNRLVQDAKLDAAPPTTDELRTIAAREISDIDRDR